ncbi:Uncharacterised protein [Yersinia enterocolitica]|uniref:Uncharacterized protein n=1 Tax=Yersinia enterocolitica TaxID=630 RepID=A0ABP1XZ43_YEREN|nr:Uncharacterised protein [Yersinia enterocolitica]CQD63577.1 Uncharacterised protein [Yersinia enterocolitica]CRX96751.1 Uncharacterised protein [Yersinia enterocolitica]
MAAGIPKEKAAEYVEMYAEMLTNGESIDELTYRRIVKELKTCIQVMQ